MPRASEYEKPSPVQDKNNAFARYAVQTRGPGIPADYCRVLGKLSLSLEEKGPRSSCSVHLFEYK